MADILRRVFVKDSRLHPAWRVALYLPTHPLVTVIFSIIAMIPYTAVVYLLGHTELINAWMRNETTSDLVLISALTSLVATLPLTWIFRRFLDGRSFASLGFRLRGPWPVDVGLGLVLGFVLMALIFAVQVGAGWLRVDGLAWVSQGLAAVITTVLIYLVVYVIVGLTEELAFRGYVFVNLREINMIVAVLVSSAFFGLGHALNPHVGPVALLNIALVGVFFCYAYLVTDNLWLPIAYHFSWNFCQGTVFSFPVSGTGGEGLFLTTPVGGPEWITGGAFGPEAGLLGTAAILASFLVVWLWARVRPSEHAT